MKSTLDLEVSDDATTTDRNSESDVGAPRTAELGATERDSVTVSVAPADAPYVYGGLDDTAFHTELSQFVTQAQEQYAACGLTLYYRILPGLQDAQRRFEEHAADQNYTLNGCKGIEEYEKSLGIKPATVRKWRQREKERQALQEIDFLVGRPKPCELCGRQNHHLETCSRYKDPPLPLPKDETTEKLLAAHGLRMTQTLVGRSIDSPQERFEKAVRMAESVQEAAANGYQNLVLIPAAAPSIEPYRDPLPSGALGTFEELGQRIAEMADTEDIRLAVQQYIDEMFAHLCDANLMVTFSVHVLREGRSRIEPGDWVELIVDGEREKQLGRVVDVTELRHPRIQWFKDNAWQQPASYDLNSQRHPHVISTADAQDKYPDAFVSYHTSDAQIDHLLENLKNIAEHGKKHHSPSTRSSALCEEQLRTMDREAQGECADEQQNQSDATPDAPSTKGNAEPTERQDGSEKQRTTASRVEQAEQWLLRYLKNGPMQIPDSYIKSGLCRYNYATHELPPKGIGKKTIDIAIRNLGIQKLGTGPKGGIRWHLPSNHHQPEDQTAELDPPSLPTLVPEVLESEQGARAFERDSAIATDRPDSQNCAEKGSATADTKEPALMSRIAYAPLPPHGPRVLEVQLAKEFGQQSGQLKYYVCEGEKKSEYQTLVSAIAACEELAKQWHGKAVCADASSETT